jgi:hypothetical protein
MLCPMSIVCGISIYVYLCQNLFFSLSTPLSLYNSLFSFACYSIPPKDIYVQHQFIVQSTDIVKQLASLPPELLPATTVNYSQIWEQTRWWTERSVPHELERGLLWVSLRRYVLVH